MTKGKHSNFLNTVEEVFQEAIDRGIWQLSLDNHRVTKNDSFDGRLIYLKNVAQPLINFGNCSYLGLETDPRLKQGAIEATQMFGIQVSSSRAYLSAGLYDELEEKFERIFAGNIVISPTTTLGHLSIMPTLIGESDLIILDQFVHASIYRAVITEKARGLKVELIRHNNLQQLEDLIKENQNKYEKIWYMIDGIYSMYGQTAPIKALVQLMERYGNFHLYVDDAHGMSWAGKHGRGYTLSQMELNSKMILTTSLGKAFGTCGGVLIFPEKRQAHRVRTIGYPMIFSGPLVPSILGASLVSADIMLSPEITIRQKELRARIDYGNQLIIEKNLPYVELSESPIFFICLGHPRIGYNISKRLINEGFYTNLAIFPAVPVKNTGLRLTFTLHTTKEDIKSLMDAVEYHLPLALADEGQSLEDIYKAFDINANLKTNDVVANKNDTPFHVQVYTSIHDLDKALWDTLFVGKGTFTSATLALLEQIFNSNSEQENNWVFRYYFVYDDHQRLVAASFFTLSLLKDDLFASERKSMEVEKIRLEKEPYFLTSLVFGMGSPLTEGEHLYIDKNQPYWEDAIKTLLEQISCDRTALSANSIILRDFREDDTTMQELFLGEGFIPVEVPDNHILNIENWSTEEEYLNSLPRRYRKQIRLNILAHRDKIKIEYPEHVSDEIIDKLYELYSNVKRKSYALNTFELPKKVIKAFTQDKNWDLLLVKINDKKNAQDKDRIIAFGISFKSGRLFCPLVIGVDYGYQDSYEPYRQVLFHTVLRAKQLGCKQVNLQFLASQEKRRLGAEAIPMKIYVESSDDFNQNKMSVI